MCALPVQAKLSPVASPDVAGTPSGEAAAPSQPPSHTARTPAAPGPSPYLRWSGVINRVMAGVLVVPGAILMIPLVVIIRLTSRGPAFYAQKRVGKDGRPFTMYKLRTMRHDAEARSGPVWSTAADPRVTPVGRVLRKLHLDELPQILNVLRGEMHLFGPRPERPEFVRYLSRRIPGYGRRLTVPPGISGLAQINLPPDTDLQSVHRKVVLDSFYIEQAGPLLDARVFFCTLLRMLGLPGNAAMVLLGLDYRHLVEALPELEQHAILPEGADDTALAPTPWREHFDSEALGPKWEQQMSVGLALGKAFPR